MTHTIKFAGQEYDVKYGVGSRFVLVSEGVKTIGTGRYDYSGGQAKMKTKDVEVFTVIDTEKKQGWSVADKSTLGIRLTRALNDGAIYPSQVYMKQVNSLLKKIGY